jgi:hypothetical protein
MIIRFDQGSIEIKEQRTDLRRVESPVHLAFAGRETNARTASTRAGESAMMVKV